MSSCNSLLVQADAQWASVIKSLVSQVQYAMQAGFIPTEASETTETTLNISARQRISQDALQNSGRKVKSPLIPQDSSLQASEIPECRDGPTLSNDFRSETDGGFMQDSIGPQFGCSEYPRVSTSLPSSN